MGSILRQDVTSQFNLLCIQDRSWSHGTLQSTCAGFADMSHHAQFENDQFELITIRRSDTNGHFSAIPLSVYNNLFAI